ncbi:unnamed protein product [Phytomonas sp. Hart1]|nr:unnamed protein product [Phytomonas sp. Hart1]|eukprot:CCW67325.1 unnamed protein product [Phytomonas sp. isolate Hart1]
MALRIATDIFLRKAQERSVAQEDHTTTILQNSYDREVVRIDHELQQYRQQKKIAFIPPLYRRRYDPDAEEVIRLFHETSKLFELNLRFREIEKLDEMHAKLWKLLNKGGRMQITLQEYKEVLHTLEKEVSNANREENCAMTVAPTCIVPNSATCSSSATRNSIDPGSLNNPLRSPVQLASVEKITLDGDLESKSKVTPPPLLTPCPSYGVLTHSREQSLCKETQAHGTLGEMLYMSYIDTPCLNLGLFFSCLCGTQCPKNVDIAVIYQIFAKKVSLVKCEAELLIWDTDNDGKLTEDEMESYVGDLVPRIVALQGMPEADLPFYCCTVTRRIFWDLDQGNRGFIRIGALLQSTVMDEWVTMQLQTEDSPSSWFSAMATQQLYSKFILLDTRNVGTLDAASLKFYKKGLPTIIDDGLHPDVSPLCALFIDRYFETNTMTANRDMDYRRFVDFVVAVEMLPQCSRPVFWWDILDLDGTGVITPLKANFFFKETHAKLVAAKLEVPSIESVIEETFDLIKSAEPLCIRRDEFIASPQAGLFTGMLIDCLCFCAYESREHR